MNRRLLFLMLFLVLILVVPAALYSQELTVVFREGMLRCRTGGAVTEKEVGDSIPLNAVLELAPAGYAELEMDGATITLSRGGEYRVRDLVGGDTVKVNFRSVLFEIGSLFKGRRDVVVASTMADEQNAVPRQWFMTDAEAELDAVIGGFHDSDYLWTGLEMLEETDPKMRDLNGAAMKFYEGSTKEFDAESRSECAFRLGLVSQEAGEMKYARETLLGRTAIPEPGYAYYPEYVVVVAALRIEAREYDEARELLEPYLASNPSGELAGAAAYLYDLID